MLLGFLGLCAIVTQGYIVRVLLKRYNETRILGLGLAFSIIGLIGIGYAPQPTLLYLGLAALALGSGLVNPSTTGLISLYSNQAEQGRAMGIFRSLGSLSRAITPVIAGAVFWIFGATSVFVAGAAFAAGALWLSLSLPKPVK
jgi:MFS family permease